MSGVMCSEFGHWTSERLPRFFATLMTGLPSVPIFISEGQKSYRQSLGLVAPGGVRIAQWPRLGAVSAPRARNRCSRNSDG